VTLLRVVAGRPARPAEPGLMWRHPPGDLPGRACWWITLPCWHPGPGSPGEVSWRTTDQASRPPHGLWAVSGAPPLITVTPSIDIERWVQPPGGGPPVRDGSHWHGWITAGVLVDAR
jgi:hypothetical protein